MIVKSIQKILKISSIESNYNNFPYKLETKIQFSWYNRFHQYFL